VPVHPHSAAGTLWHQGPITRTVDDAALLLSIMAQPDARDWYRIPHTMQFRAGDKDIRGRRIAYSRTLGYADVDPAVDVVMGQALEVLRDCGAQVEEIELDFADPIEIMQPMWAVALALAMDQIPQSRRDLLERPLVELAAQAAGISALDYRRLELKREAFGQRLSALHDTYDLLVTPQMPITAFDAGHEVPPGTTRRRWWEWSPFTYPFNLSQQPCASVPCGFAVNGLPVALQLVGAKFHDLRVLCAARAFEQARPFAMPETRRSSRLVGAVYK